MPFKVYLVLNLDRLQESPTPPPPRAGAEWEAPHLPVVLSENPPLSQFFISVLVAYPKVQNWLNTGFIPFNSHHNHVAT